MSNTIAAKGGTFTIGNDITINRMGYGAMRITGDGVWGPPASHDESIAVLKKCVDLGIDFIDTADSYGPFVSEELIREALHPYDGLLIATKGGLERQGPNKWPINATPKHLEIALKGSLLRLDVEQIDLYQLHRFDPDVPKAETLGKLKELQDEGLFKHFGVSEVSVEDLEEASQHMTITTVQNMYNLQERKHEPVLQWCEQNGAAFIPWYPLAANKLEKEKVQPIADRHDASVHQIALAWLLHHSDCILPIPGTSSVAHLVDNTKAAAIQLSDEDMAQLNAIGKP